MRSYGAFRLRSRARLFGVLVFIWAAALAMWTLFPSVPVLIGDEEYSRTTETGLWLRSFFRNIALSIVLPPVLSTDKPMRL